MQKAKEAIGEFMHRAGHHDTTVHEKIAPAVVNETITKTRHDEVQTAIDREVHQDHYHTTIQPVRATEVAPEIHKAVIAPTQEREIDHGNDAAVARALEQEQARLRAQFNQRKVVEGQHTQETGATIVGEHVHHHVHETIQPVIQKEVIQPSVVHTTVPIHEVHHNEPVHHAVSALPAVSLTDFQRQGGTLSGREERVDHFEGDPKPVASTLGGGAAVTASPSLRGSHSTTTSPTTGGLTGSHSSTTSPTTGYSGTHRGTDGQIGDKPATHHSSALLNKLDPRVDSDGDGRAGIGK